MIDSFLLTVIFVWIGFLILLFLAYFPHRTIWYDRKHGLKHTITDTSITTEWDVSNVKYMRSMFRQSKFDNDISKWHIGPKTDMYEMFKDCPLENKPEFQCRK